MKKKEKDDPILKKIKMSFFNLYELVVPLDNAGMHSDIYDVWNLDVDNLDNYRKQIHRKFFCEVGYSELVISSEMHMYPCVASVRSDYTAHVIFKVQKSFFEYPFTYYSLETPKCCSLQKNPLTNKA